MITFEDYDSGKVEITDEYFDLVSIQFRVRGVNIPIIQHYKGRETGMLLPLEFGELLDFEGVGVASA